MRARLVIGLVGLAAVAASTVVMWRSRVANAPSTTLVVRRVAPDDEVLRGSPLHPVEVELELANSSDRPIELAPLKLSCNCQLGKDFEKVIPARGATRVSLTLRYPPAMSTAVPLAFYSPTGTELARTEIVLHADRKLPYFVQCPDVVEIKMIEGVSDGTWSTSATTFERADAPPHVTGCRITSGGQWLNVSHTSSKNGPPGGLQCQRTYQLAFQLLEEAWQASAESETLRGVVALDLDDGTQRSIPWSVTWNAPLVLFYDEATGRVRGVRRGGASGEVVLRCIPEGSGTLTPQRFEAGQPIVAALEVGSEPARAVEADYHGVAGSVRVTLSMP